MLEDTETEVPGGLETAVAEALSKVGVLSRKEEAVGKRTKRNWRRGAGVSPVVGRCRRRGALASVAPPALQMVTALMGVSSFLRRKVLKKGQKRASEK